jgi:hypothetical protein
MEENVDLGSLCSVLCLMAAAAGLRSLQVRKEYKTNMVCN